MENASKALIIAGAILISIVLVSVGVIVVNSLNPDSAVEEMTKQEVDAFNSKFNSSIGDNKLGSVAKNLISTVMTNNSNTDASNQVSIQLVDSVVSGNAVGMTADGVTLSSMRNKVNTSARYNIVVTATSNGGRVQQITITRVGNTSN